jgi:hypothetical protein
MENWGRVFAMTSCVCHQYRVPGGFHDFSEFDQFNAEIKNVDFFREVPVLKTLGGVGGLMEAWFECQRCGQIWRLVEPDPPFKGMWSQVNSEKE